MDSETEIANDTNTSHQNETEQTASKSAFDASSWQNIDSAFLQPSQLAIPKVQRAWDRRPLTPFSRQRLRVGKVWKRPVVSLRSKAEDEMIEPGRANKRRKARTSFQGPLKPVKKMCLSSDFGMAARVLQWDAAESPVRKIVTRSNAGDAETIALPDEIEDDDTADEQEDADVTVEILDEDGTVLDVGGEELAKDQEWEDDVDEGQDDESDGALINHASMDTKSTEAIEMTDAAEITLAGNAVQAAPLGLNLDDSLPIDARILACDEAAFYPPVDTAEDTVAMSGEREAMVLPDGFISPAKRALAPRKRAGRQSLSTRRRTLPVQFAPFVIAEEPSIMIEQPSAQPKIRTAHANAEDNASVSESSAVTEDEVMSTDAHDGGKNDAWEDVEEAAEFDQPLDVKEAASDADANVLAPTNVEQQNDMELETRVSVVQQIGAHTNSKLPSSPIPTIEGQHPRLPLRRSPRRKSSSPLKQSTIIPSTERSHLIAFTPLKGPATYPSPSSHPGQHNPFDEEAESPLEPTSPLERAASAPPEEPRMSPHKPSRPRVSDDTALLQAFLNRAAEGKNSRRISATKRESITNRRDSDAVRQALASPAKAEVLADLDPNSPSPRKPNSASVFDGVELGVLSQDELDDTRSGPTTRRGDRAAKRAQPQTPAAPNKIAIRANAENVFIKRSEAQELAQLTRNNTRKNKGGAVLPPLRLTKLTSLNNLVDAGDGDDDMQSKKPNGKRNIKWAEVLVEFYQDGGFSESSVLSDELNGPAAAEVATKADTQTFTAAPPPAETPSKPKIRRLKPPRTAATPGKPLPPPVEKEQPQELKPEPKEQAKPAPATKRRSRIATPAKALKTASFWSDLETEPPAQAPSADRKPVQKKKAPTSKLPAPASASASMSASTSSLGQGKENLISSPPKKRTVPTAKTFAPKLDFGSKTQLQPSTNGSSDADVAVLGLASPAKKAKGRAVVFGHVPAPDFGGTEKKEDVPGLSSPAKKRTRRAGGAHG